MIQTQIPGVCTHMHAHTHACALCLGRRGRGRKELENSLPIYFANNHKT